MRRLRPILAVLLAPLLLLLSATPVFAGTPKDNQAHPAWLTLNPVPSTTDERLITITGRVAGKFDMTVTNDQFSRTFQAEGKFSVEVELFGGPNRIRFSGDNGHGRLLGGEVNVYCTAFSTPARVTLALTGSLVADGQSTATLTATVVDAEGAVVKTFSAPLTVTSSDPSGILVVTPTVTPVNGVATVTLRAGASAEPVEITVATVGLPDAVLTVTPNPQAPARLALIADPVNLSSDGTARGLLFLQLKDAKGNNLLQLAEPLLVRLVSDNAAVIHFGSGQSITEVTMTEPSAEVFVYGGKGVGSGTITGLILTPGWTDLPVGSAVVNTVKIGVPYRFSIDPIPTAPAGSQQQATVRVLDYFGNQVTDQFGSTSVTLTRQGPDGSTETVGTASLENGYGTLSFTTPAAGSYTLTASGKWYGYDLLPGQVTYVVIP